MSQKAGSDNNGFQHSEQSEFYSNGLHSESPDETPQKDLEHKNGNLAQVSWSMDDIVSAIGLGPWTFFIFLVGGLSECLALHNILNKNFI